MENMLHVSHPYRLDYLGAWRYLFSDSYRQKIHQRWGGGPLARLTCCTGGVLSLLMSIGLVALAMLAIRSLI